MKRYSEPIDASQGEKESYLASVLRFLQGEEARAREEREAALLPLLRGANAGKLTAFREKYAAILGIPRAEGMPAPEIRLKKLGRDDYGEIYRFTAAVMPGFETGGLLMLPENGTRKNAKGEYPLVICQHGGGGTPEYLADFFEEECGGNAYCHMTERALSAGFAVFAPMLLLWKFARNTEEKRPTYRGDYNRGQLDVALKRLGYSMTGLEIFCLCRMLSALCARPDVDGGRVGMAGVSYGGYFSLHMAAYDTRVRAIYSAAVFNDRDKVCFGDWGYQGAAHLFADAEVAALCAPRPLFIDVGRADTVFDYTSAIPEAERAEKYYRAAGAGDKFSFSLHEAGHRFSPEEGRFEAFLAAIDPQN